MSLLVTALVVVQVVKSLACAAVWVLVGTNVRAQGAEKRLTAEDVHLQESGTSPSPGSTSRYENQENSREWASIFVPLRTTW